MIVLCVVLAVALVALVGFVWWRSPRGLLVSRARRRVLVTTKSGDVFAGVLYETDSQVCVLRDASVIGDGGSMVAADGEVLVFRADIAYVQLP